MTKGKTEKRGGFLEFLASVRLTFAILLVLALVSVAGTIVPQNAPPQQYLQLYGEAGYRLVHGLMLDNMYRAPWFLVLLLSLAVNLIVCSLKRVPTVLRILRKEPAAELGSMRQPAESFLLEGAPDRHEAAADGALKRLVGVVAAGGDGQGRVSFAQKGGWSRWGVYVVHTSVLIIMAGAIIGKLWGISGWVQIPQGQAVDHFVLDNDQTGPLPFVLRVDKFTADFYPDGRPREYRSDVTFLVDGKELKKAALMVNDPADFMGYTFYQASYGDTPTAVTAVYHKGETSREITLPAGAWIDLPGGGQATLVDARAEVDMGGMYRGPAARIGYRENPQAQPQGLMAIKEGVSLGRTPGPVSFGVLKVESVPYTGLQVKSDPGVWLVWLGCTLMVLGFVIAFYFSHIKAWVRLCPAGKARTRVEIAVSANKNKAAARRLAARLAAALGKPGDGAESRAGEA